MVTPYRTALITGASSGIGRALCLELARAGVHVYAAARRVERLQALVAEAPAGQVTALVLDVADCETTVARIRALDNECGGLDLIVANAGASPAHDVPPDAWETLREPCHTNFCGAVATLTAVLPQMVARRRGHLVGVSSLASFGALPAAVAYSAPKAGLSMLLACLRLDLRGTGVAVTTVRPGFVSTPHVASSPHPVPQMMSEAAAAALIARRLPRRPERIDFPQPLAWTTRLFALLPEWLRGPILRGVTKWSRS
ncbi:MAG: SDR family NAD(P)-dependent oxidoreductase [Deltaproteobacteria bacterium]|nr:SDR family NAD(P)-dependent oxidoreductase [Deltaproteobacteria bacterium]